VTHLQQMQEAAGEARHTLGTTFRRDIEKIVGTSIGRALGDDKKYKLPKISPVGKLIRGQSSDLL